ncbi:MAG: DDE-type integrase/transposase/recombinase, partial [Actinobacteria bacterium]
MPGRPIDCDEVPVRRGGGRTVPCLAAVPARRCDRPGLLRVEAASAERAPARRPPARRTDPRDRSRERRDLRAPRIYSELKLVDGIRVGKKRVARLMRQLGIRGADGRRGGPRTTVRDPKRDSAPDLVDRDLARAEPNRLWVCDLKYLQTGQGFLFLAALQDVFSRRIIGWSMRDDLKAELVLDALGIAVSVRGDDAAAAVADSDHGSQ